jgi:aminoglycoside phosphotransferase
MKEVRVMGIDELGEEMLRIHWLSSERISLPRVRATFSGDSLEEHLWGSQGQNNLRKL